MPLTVTFEFVSGWLRESLIRSRLTWLFNAMRIFIGPRIHIWLGWLGRRLFLHAVDTLLDLALDFVIQTRLGIGFNWRLRRFGRIPLVRMVCDICEVFIQHYFWKEFT